MYLSKSKYCLLWQCPKLLWLDTYHRELKVEDTSLEDRMAAGNEIGDLAMGLFGEFTEVTVLKEDGRPDISAMIEWTQRCIADGVENICEASFSYPIYFLDFETTQSALPPYVGTKPYQQIPFQYSLHYTEAPGGELKHKEFLAESGIDPRKAIAESLCRNVPMNVCVTAYNKGFECGRLKELSAQFTDLAEHLLNIQDNVRDLLVPFQSGYYYNRTMGGSFSIKSVLPALFPDDPALDYHNLEGVHNGSEAMTVFPKIKDMSPEDAAETRKNLLEYCKLDTYAMVKVWGALTEAAK